MGNEGYTGQELYLSLEKLDIDMNIGIKYCGDEDFYREILVIAYESYLERAPKLAVYFAEADYKNYTILVHSIKSGAANIGAIKLSHMAKALEDAGKNEDYAYIMHNHQSFVDYYHKRMKGLADVLQLEKYHTEAEVNGQCYELQEISKEDLRDSLEKVHYYLEELELDLAEELIDNLICCKLNQKEKEVLSSMKTLLGSFGVERAKEKLHTLLNETY